MDRTIYKETASLEARLHEACYYSDTQRARILIEKGADVNRSNEDDKDQCPLHLCAVNGDLETSKLLLSNEAAIDLLNEDLETPLHKACQSGHLEVAEELLARGADINKKSIYGSTPLHLACHYNRPEVVKLLLRKSAKSHIQDIDHLTPLDIAAGSKNSLIVELLSNERSRNSRRPQPPSASRSCSLEMLRKVAHRIPAKWEVLVRELGLSHEHIHHTKNNVQHHNSQRCLYEMLCYLREHSNEPFTCGVLCTALRSTKVNELSLADELESN